MLKYVNVKLKITYSALYRFEESKLEIGPDKPVDDDQLVLRLIFQEKIK